MRLRWLGVALCLLVPLACDAPPQPVANAGSAQMVAVRQLVELDGSASMSKVTTAGAAISRFAWAFTSVPSGSTSELVHPDIARPSFTPDLAGDYVVQLTVYDANGSNAASVTITATDCAPMIAPIVAMPASPNVGDDVTLSTTVTKGPACDDREPFVYAWSIVSLPPGSKASLAPAAGGTSAALTPIFHADVAGDYKFALRVTDAAGRASTAAATVTAGNCGNNAPSVTTITATPATPNTGDVVQLAATVADPDTDPAGTCKRTQAVSYAWTLLATPMGSTAALDAGDSAVPWFRPDLNGAYTVRLVVTDSTGLASPARDFVITVADCGSKLPVIAAITPSTVSPFLGQQVALAATVTDDNMLQPCNKLETFGYAWTLIAEPAQSIARLTGASSATPTFVADAPGAYKLQLTVTDSDGHVSAPVQSAVITASACGASAPVAQIGILAPWVVPAPAPLPPLSALQVPIGAALQLDASTSSDPDNKMACALPNPQTLSYTWRFELLPPGSKVTLNDVHATNPSFSPDVAGPYLIDLFVTDNTGLTSPAARVQVLGFNSQPTVAWGVGPYTALALDGTDPRIAYYDKTRGGAFIATCSGPGCATNPTWSINPIDNSNAAMGRMISLAASKGNLYSTYWDAANCQAMYAVSIDGGKTWKTSPVQANNTNVNGPNGAITGCGTFVGNVNNFVGGGSLGNCPGAGNNVQLPWGVDWRDNGSFPSVAVSPTTGNPAVAFVGYVQAAPQQCTDRNGQGYTWYPFGYNELRYAVCTANCTTANPTWTIRSAATGTVNTANSSNPRIGYTSIAYDAAGKIPSIAFRSNNYVANTGVNALGYVSCTANCDAAATFSAPAWVDPDSGFDAFNVGANPGAETTTTSLAMSSTSQPSIAYLDGRNQWLRLASCAQGCTNAANWSGVVVDASGSVGQYPSLALSQVMATLDKPRIAYLNTTGGTLRYAAEAADGSWSMIDLDKSAGYNSLKLTATDGVRLSHYNSTAVRFFTSGN